MLTGMAAKKAQNFLRGGENALQILTRYRCVINIGFHLSLGEMCPDTEFYEVRIFFPAFGLNAGKYEPQKTPNLEPFHAVSQVGDIFMANVFPSVK